MRQSLFSAYVRATVGHPLVAALLVALLFGLALVHATEFRLDASSDSLVLESDDDLAYYRTVTDRYGSEEFIVVTYTPDGDLFSDDTLARLAGNDVNLPGLKIAPGRGAAGQFEQAADLILADRGVKKSACGDALSERIGNGKRHRDQPDSCFSRD